MEILTNMAMNNEIKQNDILIKDGDKYEVKNITDICKNIELIDINFKKCVNGYHLIHLL